MAHGRHERTPRPPGRRASRPVPVRVLPAAVDPRRQATGRGTHARCEWDGRHRVARHARAPRRRRRTRCLQVSLPRPALHHVRPGLAAAAVARPARATKRRHTSAPGVTGARKPTPPPGRSVRSSAPRPPSAGSRWPPWCARCRSRPRFARRRPGALAHRGEDRLPVRAAVRSPGGRPCSLTSGPAPSSAVLVARWPRSRPRPAPARATSRRTTFQPAAPPLSDLPRSRYFSAARQASCQVRPVTADTYRMRVLPLARRSPAVRLAWWST